MATYTESGGTGKTALDQSEAVAVMLEKYEVCLGLFHGFDRSKWTSGTPAERLGLLPAAQEHILAQDNGKERCLRAVRELSQAFALAVPHEDALRIRDDVAFFQAVQSVLAKRTLRQVRKQEDLDHAVRQIVSRAVASEGVIDIFAAAGLKKPDISILSDEFLAEVRGMPRRNLAVELLQKLLKGETRHPPPQECGPGALLRRDAGADPSPLSKPRYRGRAGDRGVDPACPRDARSRRPRR